MKKVLWKDYAKSDLKKKFGSQLTKWQKEEEDLAPFIEPFTKYEQTDKGIIVFKAMEGYAMFTKGHLISGATKLIARRVMRLQKIRGRWL